MYRGLSPHKIMPMSGTPKNYSRPCGVGVSLKFTGLSGTEPPGSSSRSTAGRLSLDVRLKSKESEKCKLNKKIMIAYQKKSKN
jgi:hypothetical protein